jgi:hypothetical protein
LLRRRRRCRRSARRRRAYRSERERRTSRSGPAILSGCPGLLTSLCNSSKMRRVSAVVSSATAVHPSQWHRRRSLRQSTQRRPQSTIGPAPLRVSASASTTHSSSSSSRGIPASRSPKQQRASVFIPPRSIRFSNGSKHAVRSASADASCTRQLAPRALDGSSSGVRPATPGNAAQSGDANPSDARSTVDGHARALLLGRSRASVYEVEQRAVTRLRGQMQADV